MYKVGRRGGPKAKTKAKVQSRKEDGHKKRRGRGRRGTHTNK